MRTTLSYNMCVKSSGDADKVVEAVVDDDGNAVISSRQLPNLSPGAHLKVHLHIEQVGHASLRGLLPDLPDLTWEDFEAVSRATRADVEASVDHP